MKKGTCPLCGQVDVNLVRSHIIPAKVYKEMLSDTTLYVEDGEGEIQVGVGLLAKNRVSEPILCGPCDNKLLQPYEREGELAFFSSNMGNRVIFAKLRNTDHTAYSLFGVDEIRLSLYLASIMLRSSFASKALGAGISLSETNVHLYRQAILSGTEVPENFRLRSVYHLVEAKAMIGLFRLTPWGELGPKVWFIILGHVAFLVEEVEASVAWVRKGPSVPLWTSPFEEEDSLKVVLFSGELFFMICSDDWYLTDNTLLEVLFYGSTEERMNLKLIARDGTKMRPSSAEDHKKALPHYYLGTKTYWQFHYSSDGNIYLRRYFPGDPSEKRRYFHLPAIDQGTASSVIVRRALSSTDIQLPERSFRVTGSDLIIGLNKDWSRTKSQIEIMRKVLRLNGI